jgi:predicted aldo/keto reductase-like oxidoreductase
LNYKILGKTGIKVSEIGFGALQFSRIEEKEAIRLVREAYDMGINLIDTGYAYPNSEYLLGKALNGIRDNIIIVSKSMGTDKKEFIDEFETSLKRLKIDHIDIYLFHDISKFEKFDKLVNSGTIEALIKEKQKGKVNYIGFSCHNPAIINRYYEIDEFSVLFVPVNFISTEFVSDVIYKKAINHDIGILGMKPLCGGRVSDVELCFKYLSQFDKIIPVVGIENVAELRQNVKCIESNIKLEAIDNKRIEEIRNELGTKFCRGCEYCMPCPQNIDIATVNFLKIWYKHVPKKEFFTNEMTEKVKKAENDCVECGLCEEKCPFNLSIRELLKENIKFYYDLLTKSRKSSY